MKNDEKHDISKLIKQLMTYEGRIDVIYHENLTRIFNQLNSEFNFTGRKNKSNSRNYNVQLKEKILSMTPDEQKRLGINKSTLWHVQKNITDGKTKKIYDKKMYKLNYMN